MKHVVKLFGRKCNANVIMLEKESNVTCLELNDITAWSHVCIEIKLAAIQSMSVNADGDVM